ncbi:ROK family protein [Streptosporangium sp. NPDC002721]|uniref:ROK family protein n=1 Tax=Streptosporangium sp. NPDC002721 TaxID=3366188 RepID=UPI003676E73E
MGRWAIVRPERRTVRDVRKGNRAMLLRTLYFSGPVTRNELTRLTGLSAATVSSMTGDLLAENIVVEAGQTESDGGRPRAILRVNPVYGHVVGVDVAETHVRVELFDLEMNERARVEYALRPARHQIELVVRHILAGVEVVLGDAGVPAGRALGVGVGVPGIVEGGPDALIHTRTFGWDGVPMGALLRAGTTLPFFVENGTRALGRAELWPDPRRGGGGGGEQVRDGTARGIGGPGYGSGVAGTSFVPGGPGGPAGPGGSARPAGLAGPDGMARSVGPESEGGGAGRGSGDAVIVLIGSGVGAAIVSDSMTFRGVSSSAGEWGHTKIVVNGRTCRCGGRGCLEAYIGAEGILDRAGVPTRTADWQAELSALVESGSPVISETVTYLGVGLSNLINLINPERIVIGGWLGLLLGRHLLDDIRAASAENSLPRPYAATSIVLGRLGPDAVAHGAATLVLDEFLNAQSSS